MNDMFKAIILTILTSFLITLGQVFWKLGIQKAGGFYMNETSIIQNIIRIVFNGYVFSGFVIYGIATFFFMYLISKFDVSFIIPLSSISYVFVLLAGAWVFKEEISIYRLLGVMVIILGVYLISKK